MKIETGDFDFGDIVKDIVTGTEGTVIGVTTWVTGCAQLLVQSKSGDDGKYVEPRWFDWTRLERTGTNAEVKSFVAALDLPDATRKAPDAPPAVNRGRGGPGNAAEQPPRR